MPIIKINDNHYDYDGITVTFMRPLIMMAAGSLGAQTFDFDGEPTKEQLQKAFPTRDALVRAAKSHKRGVLNKTQIFGNLSKMVESGEITKEQAKVVEGLVKPAMCPPARMMMKIGKAGLGHLVDRLEIYQELPQLRDTVDLMVEFIKGF